MFSLSVVSKLNINYFSLTNMWSVFKMAQSKYVAICLFAHGNSCVNLLQWCKHLFVEDIIEPRQDKTNKVTVCLAKTQISLGIRPD